MMSSPKPTILFTPGAFHKTSYYHLVIQQLVALSYPTSTSELRTANPSSPDLDWRDDVKGFNEVLLPLLDAGKEVVLVSHSYGAIPACAATKDQSLDERRQRGETGGIKALLIIAGLLPSHRGGNGADANMPSDVSWIAIGDDGYCITAPDAKAALYNDLDPSEQDKAIAETVRQSRVCFRTPVEFGPEDQTVPTTYLITELDKIVYPEVQEKMAAAFPKMKTERCGSAHSPMLSMPDEVVRVILKIAES